MGKEEEMVEAVLNIGKEKNEDLKEGFSAVYDNLFQKGILPKDALGVGDENVDKIYRQAYQLYNMGKYEDASKLFSSLIMMDISTSKYIFGLAACGHMMKHYETAAENYMKCTMYEPDNPIPYYHASDCYIQNGDTVSAMVALSMVIRTAKDRPEYKVMKDRAQMTLDSLKKDANKKIKTEKTKKPKLDE